MKNENTRPLGINLHAVNGLTDEAYIRTISDIGFDRTFTNVYEKERQYKIADLCAKYGITQETIHAPFSGINDMWLDDDRGMFERLKNAVDACVTAGVGITVVHLSSKEEAPEITDLGRERFKRLAEYAKNHGVLLAFENQRKIANLAWAMEVFPPDVAGFCWDCGHESCFTPGKHFMPMFGSRIACTHIHDNPGIYNNDAHMIPFDGNIDYSSVTKAYRDAGYKGSLMLEIGHGVSYDGMQPCAFLEKAFSAAVQLREMTDCTEAY